MTSRLETPRLILRPFAAGDWNAVNTILSDPESTRFMHFATMTADEGRQWFNECVANSQRPDVNPCYWAIVQQDSGDVLGWLGVEITSDASAPCERHVGYLLNHRYWNQGYMTEALCAVLAYEFDVRGTMRLRATCDASNLASARVLEKAGMRRMKTVFDADGTGNLRQQHHFTVTKAGYESRD